MFAPKNILVPTDLSAQAEGAMCYAVDVALENQATVHVVHVPELILFPDWEYLNIPEHENPEYYLSHTGFELKRLAKELENKGLSVITQALPSTSAAESIASYAEENDIDMIFIATNGLSDFERFLLGITTERLLLLTQCPVFVIHKTEMPKEHKAHFAEEAHAF
ncbi:MAG: universal stress protein [Bacteroidota bacterium]